MDVERLAEETANVPERVSNALYVVTVKNNKTHHVNANRVACEKEFDTIVQLQICVTDGI